MQRRWIIALDLMCFLLMVSCVTVREEVVVRRDLSGTYTLEQVWDLKAVGEELDEAQWEQFVKDAKAGLPEWARFEREKTKEKDTHRFSFDFADLQDLKKKCEESDAFDFVVRRLQWQKRGWTLACRGTIDFGDPEPDIGPRREEIIDSLTLRVTMPGPIRRTNADKVARRAVEWKWKGADKEVEVTCWLLPSPWVFAAAGLGLVVVVGGAAYALGRGRCARVTATDSTRDETGEGNQPTIPRE